MMFIYRWLRDTFGLCYEHWTHRWFPITPQRPVEVGSRRICDRCGKKQKCVGFYNFMDADPVPQWENEPI